MKEHEFNDELEACNPVGVTELTTPRSVHALVEFLCRAGLCSRLLASTSWEMVVSRQFKKTFGTSKA